MPLDPVTPSSSHPLSPPGEQGAYDAFLLLSFGGAEKPDDVLPFLDNVHAHDTGTVSSREQADPHGFPWRATSSATRTSQAESP